MKELESMVVYNQDRKTRKSDGGGSSRMVYSRMVCSPLSLCSPGSRSVATDPCHSAIHLPNCPNVFDRTRGGC